MSRKAELLEAWRRVNGPDGLNALNPQSGSDYINYVWRFIEPHSSTGLMTMVWPDQLKSLEKDVLALSGIVYAARCFANYVTNDEVYADFLDPSMDRLNEVSKLVVHSETVDGVLSRTGISYRFDEALCEAEWFDIIESSQRAYDGFFERVGFSLQGKDPLPKAVTSVVAWHLGRIKTLQRPLPPSRRVQHRDTLLVYISKRVSGGTTIRESWNSATKVKLAGEERPVRSSLICCAALAGLGVDVSPDAAGKRVGETRICEQDLKKLELNHRTFFGPLGGSNDPVNKVASVLSHGKNVQFDIEAALDKLLTPFQSH